MALVNHWPLFGLSVRSPRLELRYIDQALAVALAELAAEGIHDADTMPFAVPWTDAPPGELQRNALQFYWRRWAELRADDWGLGLAVIAAGAVVGAQDLMAKDFTRRRGFETGSWLGRRFQRQGIGTEMRQAALHLGFAGLGAAFAESAAWDDNHASIAVSRKLGYEQTGEAIELRRHEPVRMMQFRLTRAVWERRQRDDIEIDGLEPCLPLLGLGEGVA
ncbi:MAG: GNAT family N-acetyltransferase [Acidimicrobiales bacterium]